MRSTPPPRCAPAVRLPAAGLLPAPGYRAAHAPAGDRDPGDGAKAHQAFIEKRFEKAIAIQLWDQLYDSPSLKLYSSPYYLNLLLGQVDTGAKAVTIPQNRADLFSGMVRERLRRECHRGNPRFDNTALLAERDRTAILNDRLRGNRLPDETSLFAALSTLAFHIQDAAGSNERWGTRRRGEARRTMETALEQQLPADNYLDAGCDLGLFEDDCGPGR